MKAINSIKSLFDWCRTRRRRRFGVEVGVTLTLLAIVILASTSFNALPDMKAIEDTQLRKATFFDYLKPIVETRNAAIREQRDMLVSLESAWQREQTLSFLEKLRLKSLAKQYDVDWSDSEPLRVIERLKRRVDMVPVSLVLVQAAKESGWGTSRFAREANNLFGQWCYTRGCGIVPASRAAGAKHEVRKFSSVEDAIDAYLHNINTGDAYRSLRTIRADLRRAGKTPDGNSLADGLLYYSQRREAYVEEVKVMLKQYRNFQQQQSG